MAQNPVPKLNGDMMTERHKIHDDLIRLKVGIDDFQPDPKNARTGHALKQIGRSLEKYGQRKPIVVNKRTATIEAGNGTWQAAKDAGWTHIAAVVAEDDAETATGFAIADNRLGDVSFFDHGTLAELFDSMDDPTDIPGVSDDWLESLGIGEVETEMGEPDSSTEEIDPDEFQMDHKCPRCGFEFDDDKQA